MVPWKIWFSTALTVPGSPVHGFMSWNTSTTECWLSVNVTAPWPPAPADTALTTRSGATAAIAQVARMLSRLIRLSLEDVFRWPPRGLWPPVEGAPTRQGRWVEPQNHSHLPAGAARRPPVERGPVPGRRPP